MKKRLIKFTIYMVIAIALKLIIYVNIISAENLLIFLVALLMTEDLFNQQTK